MIFKGGIVCEVQGVTNNSSKVREKAYRAVTMEQLHQIMGHSDPQMLKLLPKHVTGIKIKHEDDNRTMERNKECESCVKMNMKKKPHNKVGVCAEKPLYRVFIDLVPFGIEQ